MLNKKISSVAFLIGVMLISIASCDNQLSVDSSIEEGSLDISEEIVKNDSQTSLDGNSNLILDYNIPTQEILTEEISQLLKKHEIDQDQLRFVEYSNKTFWVVKDVSSESLSELSVKLSLNCHDDPPIKSIPGGQFMIQSCDDICPPHCGGGGNNDDIEFNTGNDIYVNSSLVEAFANSSTNEIVEFISVESELRRDGLTVDSDTHQKNNADFVMVQLSGVYGGTNETWQNIATHEIQDGSVNKSITTFMTLNH